MNFQQSIILFIMATLSLTVVAASEQHSIPNFHELMARAQDSDCFEEYEIYTIRLNNIFDAKYKYCNKTARNEKSDAEAASGIKKNAFAASANQSCQKIASCSQYKLVPDSLACFSKQALQNAITSNNISVNANKESANLEENLHRITNKRDVCVNETVTLFNKKIAEGNSLLVKCLWGLLDDWPTPNSSSEESSEDFKISEEQKLSEDHALRDESDVSHNFAAAQAEDSDETEGAGLFGSRFNRLRH